MRRQLQAQRKELRNLKRRKRRKIGWQLVKTDLTAVRVLEEMRRLAFADVRTLFDEHGNLKAIHTLTDEEAACIASIKVVRRLSSHPR
jgi:Terminase small subunit